MARAARLCFVLCFLAILFGLPFLTVFGPRSAVSYYEQRTLSPLPRPSLAQLYDGTAAEDFEAAVSDRLAGRTAFLRANTALELFIGRPVVAGLVTNSPVLLDFHGYNTWDTAYLTAEAEATAATLADFQAELQAYGGYFCYLGLPLQATYFAEAYPDYMDSRAWHTEAIRDAFATAMDNASVPFINGYEVYEALGRPASHYAATDHHYSYEGAFVAYEALMARIAAETGLPLRILRETDVDFIELPNPYLGSSDRKLYGLWGGGAERLFIGQLREEIPFTRRDNGRELPAALYKLPETAEEIVTYDLYMGGDQAETVISTNRPELPSLLIFGDSFTNPLETLLWASFDETRCLDLRYYKEESLRDYVARHQPDVVVCVRDEISFLNPEGNGALGG